MPICRPAITIGEATRSLKFLKDYADHQRQIWKIFKKHQMIPEDIQDLHFHIDDFKNGIEKEFAFLKETTHKNVENFQSSLKSTTDLLHLFMLACE